MFCEQIVSKKYKALADEALCPVEDKPKQMKSCDEELSEDDAIAGVPTVNLLSGSSPVIQRIHARLLAEFEHF